MTADGFESLASHGRLSGAVTLNSVGWALSAVNSRPPPRILTSTVRHPLCSPSEIGRDHAAPNSSAREDNEEVFEGFGELDASSQLPPPPSIAAPRPPIANDDPSRHSQASIASSQNERELSIADHAGEPPVPIPASVDIGTDEFDDLSPIGGSDVDDVWLLLGLPWREGFLAMLVNDEAELLEPTMAATPVAPASAQRRWQRVWCVVQDSAVALFDHKCAAECHSLPPIAELDWSEIVSISLEARDVFSLRVAEAKPAVMLRAQDAESCAEWVCCLLRVVCWRSIRPIQHACAPEWEDVGLQKD